MSINYKFKGITVSLVFIILNTGCSNVSPLECVTNWHGVGHPASAVYQDSCRENNENRLLVEYVRERTIETQQYEVNQLMHQVLRSGDELEKLELTKEQRSLLINKHQHLRRDLRAANKELERTKGDAQYHGFPVGF